MVQLNKQQYKIGEIIMSRNEYVIEAVSLDLKYLRSYLTFSEEKYSFPCMITLNNFSGKKQYYVEKSNVKGQGFLILDWGSRIRE